MKKFNLSLIVLLFSSLLVGCGMKGPLYREGSPPPVERKILKNQATTTEEDNTETEPSETIVNEENSNNQIITE